VTKVGVNLRELILEHYNSLVQHVYFLSFRSTQLTAKIKKSSLTYLNNISLFRKSLVMYSYVLILGDTPNERFGKFDDVH